SRNEGQYHDAVVLGPLSQARWYEGGERAFLHSCNPRMGFETVARAAEFARAAVGEALEQASLSAGDVDFLFCHQPMAWLGSLVKEAAGLTNARHVESFPRFGSLGAASCALNLHLAAGEGAIAPGKNVLLYSVGAGFNYCAAVVRWD
ncbi:MAG: 3-oxoacyl-[acyl-carrier-protein] synthase III C-terminal domain-containing protein, partial [Myxococcales bacterium]